ncbi:MAG TPA: PqiC family protein [Opitutaceae bacterium]|nr:PqiC family protein [Opitutaceae bacterium]
MKPNFYLKPKLRWIWLVAIPFLFGCSLTTPLIDTTRYYVLDTLPQPSQSTAPGTLKLALRRVEAPSYLKGRSMVVRRGENEIHYIDSARWAEPLELALMRVLKEGLSSRPEVEEIMAAPFSVNETRDFDLVIHVVSCEGAIKASGEGAVIFQVTVEVYAGEANGKLLSRIPFNAEPAAWDGKNYSALAEKLSGSVAQLCAQIPHTLAEFKKTAVK